MTNKVWILDGDVAKTVLGLFSVRLLIMWNKRSLYRLFYVDVISLAQMQNELKTKEVREQLVWQNRSYFFSSIMLFSWQWATFEDFWKLFKTKLYTKHSMYIIFTFTICFPPPIHFFFLLPSFSQSSGHFMESQEFNLGMIGLSIMIKNSFLG